MQNNKVSENIAVLTGNAFQDDETFKEEGGFVPGRDQVYFELKQGDNIFQVGASDILRCLCLLEKLKEIPKISSKWWQQTASVYGDDICMVEYEENT